MSSSLRRNWPWISFSPDKLIALRASSFPRHNRIPARVGSDCRLDFHFAWPSASLVERGYRTAPVAGGFGALGCGQLRLHELFCLSKRGRQNFRSNRRCRTERGWCPRWRFRSLLSMSAGRNSCSQKAHRCLGQKLPARFRHSCSPPQIIALQPEPQFPLGAGFGFHELYACIASLFQFQHSTTKSLTILCAE
jgi:hypothetical protein